jgi:serine protease Do
MPFRLASAQTAATEALTRARALLDIGEVAGAEMVFETLLATLDLTLREDSEALPASERTLLMITGASRRLPIDALHPARLDQLAMRVAAITDIPELTTLGSMDEMRRVISAAIAAGAPRYNAGDIRGCCRIYWATMHTLVVAPAFRGFPGYERALGPLQNVIDRPAPMVALDAAGIDDYAWTLRRAFDAALQTPG